MKEVDGKIVWYIPESENYLTACKKCADKNIEEIT
jgi:hypothetical protein